jgi:hypothetical protein
VVAFRDEHATLEDELAAFVKNFREVKRDLFQLADGVVQNGKEETLEIGR